MCLLNNYQKRYSGLINNTILITNFFVYRCKTQKCLPKFQFLIHEITKINNIEYFIANRNDNFYRFARSWDDFEIFN